MAIQVKLNKNEYATILPTNPKYLAISDNFGESDMQLTGSSPKMLVNLVNSSLFPKDMRIATRKNLEEAIKRKNDFLSGIHVDFALNLDSRDANYQINSVYAKNLADDLINVGINLKNAKLISYDILTKEFRLSKKGKDIAKNCIQNTEDFNWDYNSLSSGLFRAFFRRSGEWDCSVKYLADSIEDGRIVVVSGEASSRKFLDSYVSKLENERDERIENAKIIANKRYANKIVALRVE